MNDARLKKIGRNEAAFREINESISDKVQEGHPAADEQIAIVCECGKENCSTLIYLSLDEYAFLREVKTRFGVLPGHQIAEAEDVVEDRGRYVIVEKFGRAAQGARETDPGSP